MAQQALAIPGQLLGPADKYAAGAGTHIHDANLYSSLLGTVTVAGAPPAPQPEKASSGPPKRLTRIGVLTQGKNESGSGGALPTISVSRAERQREVLPEVGNAVLCRVTRITPRHANVAILIVGETVLEAEWQGMIRVQDVRATEKDRVKIYESFRPGDIVRAQVISLGDQANYYLSTASNELGVIMATSEAGNTMYPVSWKEYKDPETATTTTTTTTSCCPNCGLTLPTGTGTDAQTALLQAQKQIDDLQAQVRLLNQKATAAVDRWADYEDELSRLRAASTTSVATSNATHASPPPSSVAASSPRSSFLPTGAAARISQLLTPRKSAPNLAAQGRASVSSPHLPPLPGNNGRDDLLEQLARERELRAKAEGRLNDTSKEVEELSATLFEQANEMVASERRARAKLEERVTVLERRDVEKRVRLEKLEGAMGRLDRVRALLGEQ
ncbi:hypothetical protein F4804DRAFT_346431 [Jackrogersella minutella]|nr:hypothetical protein F4804DRAFT_346431 [Jackrogersella minutella]